ncbi:class I adenylate-forming enzyme family protein [Actinomadura yumaensis]|uniref:class I adenylate-forming enzyme family protein n=1 Tax=Actinomadura yumaensis TaxID=111807 RepID=UPI003620F896
MHLAQLPLSHGFGMMMAVAALLSGGRLVLHERFSAEAALAAVGDEGITVVNGAPAHFKLLLNRLDQARHDVGTLRLSVGTAAPFAPELVTDIWERLGVRFMFMYGSSEGVGVATTDEDDIMRGSVGRPAPGSTAIVGPDHRPLPVGTVGEVAFSRGVYPVRYWEDHDALRPPEPEPVANGDWYYSGDLGRLDEEGRLYIVGRLKHQIDRGGLKVDPMEVENALLTRPEVADAAVLGLLNPVLGEEVCACVAPSPGEAPTLAGLRDALGERLAPHKLPEVLYLLDEIPRTRIGKVDSDRLRDLMDARRPQRLVRR